MKTETLILPAAIATLTLALGWLAFSRPEHAPAPAPSPAQAGLPLAPTGKTVIVQFRRDALGLAGNDSIPWSEVKNGTIGVQGDVVTSNDSWIVIRGLEPTGQKRDIWIPTHAILTIISR